MIQQHQIQRSCVGQKSFKNLLILHHFGLSIISLHIIRNRYCFLISPNCQSFKRLINNAQRLLASLERRIMHSQREIAQLELFFRKTQIPSLQCTENIFNNTRKPVPQLNCFLIFTQETNFRLEMFNCPVNENTEHKQ